MKMDSIYLLIKQSPAICLNLNVFTVLSAIAPDRIVGANDGIGAIKTVSLNGEHTPNGQSSEKDPTSPLWEELQKE